MAYNLHKRTKVNLADSTSTTNSTNPNYNSNNNNNNNNNDNEIAPVIIKGKGKEKLCDIENPEENERKESNNNKKGKRKMEDINEREGDSNNIQNTEQQVIDSFSGNIIIHQLLQATTLFFRLDFQSVLSLTLTSKTLFKPLSSLISQHFTFRHKHTPLIHYHPKKLKIPISDVNDLFGNPYLLSVTEIKFTTNNNTFFTDSITNYPFDKVITNFLSLNLITHLTIVFHFNQPINGLFHLTKLTHLIFNHSCGFNYPIDNLLPPNLTNLTLPYPFDHSINHLPPNLTNLTLGQYFSHPLNHLPPSLIKLSLGESFNRPINFLYLTKLTHLEFHYYAEFNHPIDNLLPPNLTKLTLGQYFSYPLNHLPPKTTHLCILGVFNHSINHLPPNLIKLSLGSSFNQPINLLYLTKLTHLEFSYYAEFNHPIDNLLPPNLTKLTLPKSFSHPLNHLPPKITHLSLPKYTPLQYSHIRQLPSILYFNNKAIKPNSN